jgi:hypothetical protein
MLGPFVIPQIMKKEHPNGQCQKRSSLRRSP